MEETGSDAAIALPLAVFPLILVRARSVDAWKKWWRDHGPTLDLARIEPKAAQTGRLLVVENFNPTTNRFTYAGGIGNATPTPAGLGLSTPTTGTATEALGGNGGIGTGIFDSGSKPRSVR